MENAPLWTIGTLTHRRPPRLPGPTTLAPSAVYRACSASVQSRRAHFSGWGRHQRRGSPSLSALVPARASTHAAVRRSLRERGKKKKKNILLSDTSIFPNSPLIKPSAGGSGTFFFLFCFLFPFPPCLSLSPLPFLGRQSATVRTISGPITFFFAFPFHIASTVFLPQRHRIHPFAQRFFRRRRSAPASCGRGYDRRADCSTAAR